MRVTINNQAARILSGNASWSQNEPGEFDVRVAATELSTPPEVADTVVIYDGGTVIMEGFVFDSPYPEYSQGKVVEWVVSGLDNLGLLSVTRAKYDAHFQDSEITLILQSLLSGTDWYLGDTSTMIDTGVKTTIDARNKESLWAQVKAVIDSAPMLFVRYGGFNTDLGKHRLDIGAFGEQESSLENLIDYSNQFPVYRPYRIVEAYGSRSGNEKVGLVHALSNPATTAHADYATYPIVNEGGGVYHVQDTTKTKGFEIRKEFGTIKTKNDRAPLSVEIAEAGFALWQKTVRFLQENSAYISGKAEAFIDHVPAISSKYYIRQQATDPRFNPLTQITEYEQTFLLSGWLRATSIGLDLGQNSTEKGLRYKLTLTDREYTESDVDSDVNLYSRLENHTSEDSVGAIIEPLGEQEMTLTYSSANAADCTGGKEYSFAPTVPSGTGEIYYLYRISPDTNVTETVTQEPTSSLPLKICVKYNGAWSPPEAITVTVYFKFMP